jgi:1,4-alpha-glucan branching enzyme
MAGCQLLLVLHCHLPYVRHPEHDDFLEEDWFYEAVCETYVPLLHVLEGLLADGVPCRVALSFSPTLICMLRNPLLGRRLERYLDRRIGLGEREVERTRGTPCADAARMYLERYRDVRATWAGRGTGGLLGAFAGLAGRGAVELIASAATHALLPLITAPECRYAQVELGLRSFEDAFGRRPAGFWLPECAWSPEADALISQAGARYYFLDTHGVLLATPRPPYGVFAPLRTPSGAFAFGRDVESSHQVWSADEGYPGDFEYREFHRDLGFDAELAYVRPYLPPGDVRRPLGFKYHRITGEVPLHEKQPYRPALAAQRAREHAAHFVAQRLDQADRIVAAIGRMPVLVCPYDAELFGHWWFEGPQFLDAVFRESARRPQVRWVSPTGCLARGEYGPQEGEPASSTWGDGGYFDVWVNDHNDWVYPDLARAERRMVSAARRHPAAAGLLLRALNQAGRELLLAQSSDWPFLMYTGTAREYAVSRFRSHVARFRDLMAQIEAGRVAEDLVARLEWLDDPFPAMDYRLFAGRPGTSD